MQRPATDEQQQQTQQMMKFMTLFMGVLFFKVPAGLCIYFITSSIWGVAERLLLPKPTLDTSNSSTTAGDTKPAKPEKPDPAVAARKEKQKQRQKKKRK